MNAGRRVIGAGCGLELASTPKAAMRLAAFTAVQGASTASHADPILKGIGLKFWTTFYIPSEIQFMGIHSRAKRDSWRLREFADDACFLSRIVKVCKMLLRS